MHVCERGGGETQRESKTSHKRKGKRMGGKNAHRQTIEVTTQRKSEIENTSHGSNNNTTRTVLYLLYGQAVNYNINNQRHFFARHQVINRSFGSHIKFQQSYVRLKGESTSAHHRKGSTKYTKHTDVHHKAPTITILKKMKHMVQPSLRQYFPDSRRSIEEVTLGKCKSIKLPQTQVDNSVKLV